MDKSKENVEEETNPDVLSSGIGAGDDTEIHVEDEVPDFLKAQDEGNALGYSGSMGEETPTEEVSKKKNLAISTVGKVNELAKVVDNIGNDVETSKTEAEPKTEIDNPADAGHAESLLENKPLVKMFEECADVVKNVERIRPAFESEEAQDLINTIREQLVQAMLLSGGKTIDNETQFDILRHKCEKGTHADGGEEIVETLEPGVSLEDRVFVKALVKINK